MSNLLEIENLSKSFGNKVVLRDVSFNVPFNCYVYYLFAAIPALEVIKYESKSGYEKYVLTLPVTRSNIVQSHYFFYF